MLMCCMSCGGDWINRVLLVMYCWIGVVILDGENEQGGIFMDMSDMLLSGRGD